MTKGSIKGHKKLLFKHRLAVNAHLSGMTKKDAMVEAGYFSGSDVQKVFGRDDVKHEIARHQEEVAKKYDIGREWVVKRLVDMLWAGLDTGYAGY